jgi:AraC-like DNA-binding protein
MISSVFARLLYRELISRGYAEADILQGTGLNAQQLWSAPAMHNAGFLQFLRNARELLKPKSVGFLIASLHRTPAVNMMGLAMTSAPTLRDGLQSMASFSVLQAEYAKLTLRAGHDHARITLGFDPMIEDCRDIHTEAVLMLLQNYIENMLGRALPGVQFSVSYPAPKHAEQYTEHLHGPVRFAAKEDALHLPTELLDSPSPFADPDLWTMSRRHLAEQLAQATGTQEAPFTAHLRTFLAAQTPPLPDIQQTADSLHLSPRTLNRRLSNEATTFRTLRLEATHDWARRLLAEGTSVDAVALQLGYDDPANFRRSFKRQTGLSPSEWRAQSGRAAMTPLPRS